MFSWKSSHTSSLPQNLVKTSKNVLPPGHNPRSNTISTRILVYHNMRSRWWWWWWWWRWCDGGGGGGCGGSGYNDPMIVRRLKSVRRYRHIIRRDKMIRCLICNQFYSRRDALRRHERNVHGSGKNIDQSQPLKEITFQHPFSMTVTGPSGSGKTEWTRKLLLT